MSRPAMVMGIETEYSIYTRGTEGMHYRNSVASAGQMMLDCVRNSIEAMGEQVTCTRDGLHPQMEHIGNGARFYLDSLHPEMSTAECQNPRDVVIWDAAGERIVQAAAKRASANLGYGVSIYKKLVDGRGHTWGCHENYCIEPKLFARLVAEPELVAEQRTIGTWLVVRQLLIGAGKIGSDRGDKKCTFQLTQRAEFIIEFRNPHTMINRPVINTKNEALADEEHYRRLHIICGDANLCQWSTYIKMGLTGLMLMMWQDKNQRGFPTLPIIDEDYSKVMRYMSQDTDFVLKYPMRFVTAHGQLGVQKYMSAPDILQYYVQAIATYAQQREWSSDDEADAYLRATEKALWATGLLRNASWRSLYGWLDWPTKRVIVEEYLRRKNKTWSDVVDDRQLAARVRTLGDVNYTAIDPAVSLFARLTKAGIVKSAVKGAEIARALLYPPPGRAAQRALLIKAFPLQAVFAHWNTVTLTHMQFKIRIQLDDPTGCEQELLEKALRESPTPGDLALHMRNAPIPGISVKILRSTNA